MAEQLNLNGDDWLFKEFIGEDWVWRNSEKPDTRDVRFWQKGSVPGSVHDDLWKLGKIPDPYFEQNSLLVEWIPARTWIYKKWFAIDAGFQGKRVQLHFKGVDYEAQFFLNGQRLGRHTGMYTPAVFEVGDLLKYGEENLLAVVIEPAPHEQPQVSRTSRVKTHKSRMTYWWDFCPRMIHIGIWDDVYLEITGDVRIEDVFVRPQLSADFTEANLSISTEVKAALETRIEMEIIVRYQGQEIQTDCSKHTLAAGRTKMDVCLQVDHPALWWPNGHGDQNLYEAEVRIRFLGDNRISDQRLITFGIRKIEWVRNETQDSTARPYTCRVNGRKIYIKGWNWVPIDVMYGVPRPEKLHRLLTLAKRAHVNMLRVWGGGLIEKDGFYNLCNRLGIMVWQEFIQSSSGIENKPSVDPGFIEMMVQEARQIVPRKRNHPSLVIWCGGNELQGTGETPLDDREPVLGALKAVVQELDPDRYWLPTSSSGRLFSNSLKNIAADPLGLHDVHGPWEHQGLTGQYTLYNQGTSLLHSEFGVEGMTNLKTLNTCISKENQWPATKDNPIWFHRGAWWINEPLIQETFEGIEEIETLLQASQFLQAEGLRYAVEANRRRKYQNSGSLPWQLNEPYPNGYCTSAIDYYAIPKPVYYALAKAYESVHVMAKFPMQAWSGSTLFTVEVWVSNSTEEEFADCLVDIQIRTAGGAVCLEKKQSVAVGANGSLRLTELNGSLASIRDDLFFLDLKLSDRSGFLLSANRYLFSRTKSLAPMLRIPSTTLSVEKQTVGDQWSLTVTNPGEQTALLVRLDDGRDVHAAGFLYLDDNHFSLLPGESKTILAEWFDVPQSDRQIEIKAWNTVKATID